MAIDCNCNSTLQNLGAPDCPPVMQIARKFIFVPRYDAAGNENRLDLNPSNINKTELLTKINASNPLDRYYPTNAVDNTEDTREDPVTQEFNSGKIITVREGARTNTSFVPLGSTQELGHYKSFGCSEFGAYVMDAGGNFIYYDKGDGHAYPIAIDNETFYCTLMKATDAEVQMLMLRWQWKLSQKDQNLRFAEADELNFTADDLNGLYDVTGTFTNGSTAGFTLKLETTDWGTPVTDLTAADTSVILNGVAVSLSSFTESATIPGTYAANFSGGVSAGDTYSLIISKAGFDFASVTAQIQTA
jgi:hypothetical protein